MTAVALHVVEEGPRRGPAVLMLGSLGSTLAMWDAQLPTLTGRYRVLRCDIRGHGLSPVPPGPYALDDLVDDTVAVLDRLGVDAAAVVGLSLGGMIGMRLAAREPDRVASLALMCTAAHLGPKSWWTDYAAQVRARGTAAFAAGVVSGWLTDPFRSAEPASVRALEEMVADTPDEGYASCCEAIAHMDLRPDLPRIAAPTLALAGAEDPALPPPYTRAIADAVPGSRLVVVPSAAHLANIEQPKAVNAALLGHLDDSWMSRMQVPTRDRPD